MINLEQTFTPRVNPADTDYPFGSIKDNTSPGANDGTPLSAVWGNDFEGFRQAAMTEAGITPSGLPDTAQDSQLLDAVKAVTSNGLRNELAGIGGESLVGGATYAQIRAYTGTGTEIKCLGRSSIFDGAHGNFVLDSSDTSSTDNDGTVLVDALNRRWKRSYSGNADAAWFGIVADSGATDNATKINAALQSVKRLKIKSAMGSAYYGIASPVYIDSEMGLESYGGAYAEIRKTTNALGVGSNTIGGQTDSYAKDAVIILRHADGAYNNWSALSGIIANGAGMGCEYGVYAPRVAHGVFDRVLSAVGTGMYGWVTHDTYMTRFEDVQVTKSYIARAGSIGFYWDDKGDGSSGTSCAFINCWARDGFDIGWKLTGLVYSSISSSGADRYGSSAIYAELCDLSIDSFGFENRLAGSAGSPLTFRYSRVDGGVFVGFSADVASGDYVLNVQGGRFKYHYIRHTSLSGSTGNNIRAADNAVILSTGGESFGAGVITTPSVDSISAIIPAAGKTDDWTPSIAGASTAGTYQLATAIGKVSRSGNSVTLTGQIVLAASVTGGGSGGLRIKGIPIAKPNNGVIPTGSVVLNGVTFTGNPVLSFTTGAASSELYIALNATGAAPGQIAITDVGANDSLSFSITYAV